LTQTQRDSTHAGVNPCMS